MSDEQTGDTPPAGMHVTLRAEDGTKREGTLLAGDEQTARVRLDVPPGRSWHQGMTCTIHGPGAGWTTEIMAVVGDVVWLHVSRRLADQRRHPRVPVAWPASWAGPANGEGLVVDASTGGVRVRSAAPLESIVMLSISTDVGLVTALAELRHRSGTGEHTDYHLELIALTPDAREMLETAVERQRAV